MYAHPAFVSADWIFPVCSPPVRDGVVAMCDGVIDEVTPLKPDMDRIIDYCPHSHFEQCVVLPGLVNAHTHLELGYLRGQIPPSHFVDWVVELIRKTGAIADMQGTVAKAAIDGMAECLRYGVTTVGDISRQVSHTRAVLRQGPLRVVSFGEVQALGRKRDLLQERLAAAADTQWNSNTLSTALSPHAPYTVEGPALRAIAEKARVEKMPLCMHLAELTEESDFLKDCSGRIREAWDTVGIAAVLLDDLIPRFDRGPIHWASHWGLLGSAHRVPVLLAHVNYGNEQELDLLAQAGAHVAYCPRTRHAFGHDDISPHPFERMLTKGINVCLATDSLASNPDLSLLREASFVAKKFPAFSRTTLLEMITTRGARALGLGAKLGALGSGMLTDMIALPLSRKAQSAEEALEDIFQNAPLPVCVIQIDWEQVMNRKSFS